MLTGRKIDAVEAVYDFEPTHAPSTSYDSENVTMELEEPTGNEIEYLETIPLLISSGFRSQLSVDTTQEGGKIFIEQQKKKYEAQIVGLIGKMGSFFFT